MEAAVKNQKAKPIRRHAVMNVGPDQAEQAMKAFAKLERIKNTFAPSVYVEDGRWQNIIEMAQAKRAEEPDNDRTFWLIALACISIAEDRFQTDEELARISAVIAKLEKKHGLKDGEIWLAGEAPDDVEEQREKWDKRADQIGVDVMRKYGEDAMAESFMSDPESFYAGMEKALNSMKDFANGNTGS